MARFIFVILLVLGDPALAQVVSYEATSLPEADADPWLHIPGVYPPEHWSEDGWFFQHCEIVDAGPPEIVEQEYYRRELDEMAGFQTWFLQWRMMTDGPQAFGAVAPAGIVAGGYSGVLYHFTIAADEVRFLRDVQLPFVFADIEPGVPHTYRLELYGGESYIFCIDGRLIDSGSPEGPYPESDSRVTFGARAAVEENITQWDYVRYGLIPEDRSGDFDSDGDVDFDDLYFFQDCLLGPDADGPGCRWADMNADGTADGLDIALFVDAMLAP